MLVEQRDHKCVAFFFFFWLGHKLGPISKRGPRGPWGPAGAGLGPREKTRYPKQGGSGPRVLSRGSGSGYEKTRPEPDPLPFLDLGNPKFQIDNYIDLSFLFIYLFFPLLSACACTGYPENGDNNPMNKVRLKKIMPCLWSIEVFFLYDS